MLRKLIFVLLFAATLFVGAAPAQAAVYAAATTPDLASVLKAVGGNTVTVVSLTTSAQDPHAVSATGPMLEPLHQTDLLVVNGMDLESGWLPILLVAAHNSKIQPGQRGYLDCSEFVPSTDAVANLETGMGAYHPDGNPHYMTDPRRAIEVAHGIAARLGEIDLPHAEYYRENAAEFAARLEDAMAAWNRQLAPYRGTKAITYHRSFTYLFDYLGWVDVVNIVAQVNEGYRLSYREGWVDVTNPLPRPGLPPDSARLDEVIADGRRDSVRLLLIEPFYPHMAAELVANGVGARLVDFLPAVRFENGETYLERFERNMTRLEQAAQAAAAEK
jgi:zinc/manganese transport system substrate-binding protein